MLLKPKNPDVSKKYDISVKFEISSTSWLLDDHIFEFARKYQTRCKKLDHLLIDSIIYLADNHLAAFVNRFVNSETNILLAIILVNDNHWILGAINLNKQSVAIFDSMPNTGHTASFRRLLMIAELCLKKQNKSANLNIFKLYLANDNPQQENSDDCGLFVARTIRNIFVEDAKKFAIRTGEYRKELVKILKNDWLTRDSPENRGANNQEVGLSTAQSLTIRLDVHLEEYEKLIKWFF